MYARFPPLAGGTGRCHKVFSISAALGVIARLSHPDAIDLVQGRLAHKDTWIRETAAQAIATGAHPGQKRLLQQAMRLN